MLRTWIKENAMFETVQPAPADPILGLTEAFRADDRAGKINLGVGVYQDETGKTPILQCVKAAENRLLDEETSKGYLPIDGSPAYTSHVQRMLFGDAHALPKEGRVATSHCPGGTGALRVAADYLHSHHPNLTIHMSDPTWANHNQIFEAAGIRLATYAYFDAAANGLNFQAMLDALKRIPKGDVVLLHACCHNPTGVDLDEKQWQQIAKVVADNGLVPLVDFAYQGFGQGIDEDAGGLRILAQQVPQMLICSSFSKNFGLYNERVGALTVVAATAEQARAVQSQIKRGIRANYSNPPSHGGLIVRTILDDAQFTAQWREELATMRDRINTMRKLFAQTLDQRNVKLNPKGNDFIVEQRGMFSFSGLTKTQVEKLRSDHAIYIVGSGRINVAGMTTSNMQRLCEAIQTVVST